MKPKVTRGSGARGLADYLLDLLKHACIVAGNMDGRTARELAHEFGRARKRRPDIQRPVWHCSLSLSAEEHRTDEEWDKVVRAFLTKMGIDVDDHAYIVVRHCDTPYDHVHIELCRIGWSGHVWHGEWDVVRAIKAAQELERKPEYKLRKTAGFSRAERRRASTNELEMADRITSKRRETDERAPAYLPVRYRLQALIDSVLADGTSMTAVEFADALTILGVSVRANVASTGTMHGFSFAMDGIPFKGKVLGDNYRWVGLQARGVSYVKIRDHRGLARSYARFPADVGGDAGVAGYDHYDAAADERGHADLGQTPREPAGFDDRSAERDRRSSESLHGDAGPEADRSLAERPRGEPTATGSDRARVSNSAGPPDVGHRVHLGDDSDAGRRGDTAEAGQRRPGCSDPATPSYAWPAHETAPHQLVLPGDGHAGGDRHDDHVSQIRFAAAGDLSADDAGDRSGAPESFDESPIDWTIDDSVDNMSTSPAPRSDAGRALRGFLGQFRSRASRDWERG